MRVTQIQIFHVRMPLTSAFRTAFANVTHIESVLVRIEGTDGVYGWGEAAPWEYPLYCSEWATGAFHVLRDVLGPKIVGSEFDSAGQLQNRLVSVRGNNFAKAALDLAWWDLAAKSVGVPLWQLIGGAKGSVDVGADIGVMESLDALLVLVGEALQLGYKRIKLKYRPGWEVEAITAVRKAFPDAVLHVDCNSAYSLHDMRMFEQLDQLGLTMIEQPLANDDLLDHAKLAARLRTPICLDESIVSLDKARKAIDVGACR